MHNIRNTDLNLLIALDALLDEENVSRAAERLSLTQPTVSGMLKRLRESFGDPLFVRTQRGLLPTPRAEALRPQVKRLLGDAAQLFEPEAFAPSEAEFTFSVSVNDYMQRSVLLPFIRVLRRLAPRIKVAVLPLEVERLSARMARGEIDLAITTPELSAPDLRQRALREEPYLAVVRPDHPIKSKRPTIRQFLAFDHLIVSQSGGRFAGPTDTALAAQGLERRVAVSVPSFLVVPELLESDDLIAVVAGGLAMTWRDRLRIVLPPLEIPGISTIAVWHPRVQHDPAHRWLRGVLAEAVKAEESQDPPPGGARSPGAGR